MRKRSTPTSPPRQDRYAYRDALAGLLQRWFGDHDLAEVRQALRQASALWSVYRSFRELVESDDVRANPLMGVIEQPGVGRYHAPASPHQDGTGRRPRAGQGSAAR